VKKGKDQDNICSLLSCTRKKNQKSKAVIVFYRKAKNISTNRKNHPYHPNWCESPALDAYCHHLADPN
jgi:hypothetical protein